MKFFDRIFNRSPKKKYVVLPNMGELELDYVIEQATELRKYNWTFKKWTSRPALIDKSGGRSSEYTGQNYDPEKTDLIEDGWTHDHCEICFATISEGDSDDDFETEGYNFENAWVCKSCYQKFIQPENLDAAINKMKIIEK